MMKDQQEGNIAGYQRDVARTKSAGGNVWNIYHAAVFTFCKHIKWDVGKKLVGWKPNCNLLI